MQQFNYILCHVQRDLDYVFDRDTNRVVYSQYSFM
jgi:hypothetical protein